MIALEQMASFLLQPVGILHVGASYGQEFEAYRASGASTVVYVEPIPEVFDALRKKVESTIGHFAIKAVCAEADDIRVNFNISSNYGGSSSFLELGRHQIIHPAVHYTKTIPLITKSLDSIVLENFHSSKFNLLVLDTQGTELRVLKGARSVLENIDCIFCEVSELPLYEGGCTLQQIIGFLEPLGFCLKWLQISYYASGDAFFVRNGVAFPPMRLPAPPNASDNIALHKPTRQSSLSPWSRPNDAAGAVSGVLTGSWGFHTNKERNPWWEVDLEAIAKVVEIRIYNRLDMERERANGIVVATSVDATEWVRVHDQQGQNFGGADGRPLRIMLPGHSARYVRIELAGEDYLHLDQVEVYAEPPQRLTS